MFQGLLICYQRYQEDTVPGCSGLGVWREDYCADRPANYLLYVGTDLGPSMLGLCEGQCNSDDDCSGTLVCFQRSGDTPVPRCDGTGRMGTAYCRLSDSSGQEPTPNPTSQPSYFPTKSPTPNPSDTPKDQPAKSPTNQPTNVSVVS